MHNPKLMKFKKIYDWARFSVKFGAKFGAALEMALITSSPLCFYTLQEHTIKQLYFLCKIQAYKFITSAIFMHAKMHDSESASNELKFLKKKNFTLHSL